MLDEFNLAKDLCHNNILQYKYFTSKIHERTKRCETHLILELIDGIEFDEYISKHGKPKDITIVKDIGY